MRTCGCHSARNLRGETGRSRSSLYLTSQQIKTPASTHYIDVLNENNLAKSHNVRKQFQESAHSHREQDLHRGLHLRPESFTSREVFSKASGSILKTYHERPERRFRENFSPKRSLSKPADPKTSLTDLQQSKILRSR